MRVIIVELNPGRSIGLGPSLADHDVACARGIDAAIEILRTSEPEVIVLDVGTESGPHLVPSPAEAFQRLADAAAGARIIVAGAGDEILVQEMLSPGVFDFLTYPDELDSLAYAVKRATRVAQLERRPSNGVGRRRLAEVVPGIVNLCLDGVDSEALLFLLEHDHRVLASAASSCASGAQGPSHVLAAMGMASSLAGGSLRLSMGWSTTEADIAAAAAGVPEVVTRLRAHRRDGAPA